MTFVVVTIERRKDEREKNRTKNGNNGQPTIIIEKQNVKNIEGWA